MISFPRLHTSSTAPFCVHALPAFSLRRTLQASWVSLLTLTAVLWLLSGLNSLAVADSSDFDPLYDQPMVHERYFKSLEAEEQNKILIEHFHLNKELLQKSSKKSFATFKRRMVQAGGLFAVGTGLTLRFWSQIPPLGQNFLRTIGSFATLLAPPLVHEAFQHHQEVIDSRSEFFEPYELDYVVKKRYLPEPLQINIEQQLRLAKHQPDSSSSTLELVRTALALPLKSREISYRPEKIKILFDGYPDDIRQRIESFCLRQVMNQAPGGTQATSGKKIAAYFYGLPGSGKSRFAEKIAQALDLPFAKISLAGASISDLTGREINSGQPTPGLIVRALERAKVEVTQSRNMVLFIDEADRVINNKQANAGELLPFMLTLLDPETKNFYNPFLKSPVDISGLVIIMAGNYPIEDEALRKRLFLVKFKGFDAGFKKKIIWESTLPALCAQYSQNGKMQLTLADLTETDRQKIDQLVECDQDPGFRTIEHVLMNFLDFKSKQKYFNQQELEPDWLSLLTENQDG